MANATNQLDKATRKLVRAWSPESVAGSCADELLKYAREIDQQMDIHGRDSQLEVHVAMLKWSSQEFKKLQKVLKTIEFDALERLETNG
jgi:hypothetical protein